MLSTPQLYPLSASQRTVCYCQTLLKSKAGINICAMLHIDTQINTNILLQALSLVFHRSKSASIRIHKNSDTDVKQYFSEQPPEPVIVLDYTNQTDEQLEKDISTWAATEFPNDSYDVQLYNCRLIKKPNGLYGILFCVSHFIFDAYSIMATATEALQLYEKLLNCQPISHTKSDPLPSYQAEWEYFDSPAYQADKDFWRNEIFATEPLYTSINGSEYSPRTENKRYGKLGDAFETTGKHQNFILSFETVNKVNELAKSLKISPQCIYMLAARSYLSKTNDNAEDIIIANNIVRRATLTEKRAGGTRVQNVLFRMNFSNSLTVQDSLIELNALQKKYYMRSNLPSNEVFTIFRELFGPPFLYGYTTFHLSYQPHFMPTSKELPVHLTLHSNGHCLIPLQLTILALDNSGNLTFNFDYQTTQTREDVPQALFNHMAKALEAITQNVKMLVSELNKL